MVICFYGKNPHSRLFDVDNNEVCLARVTWKTPENKRAKVKVMLYKRRINTFEGHIPDKPVDPADCTVDLWPSEGSSHAQAIDRLEHGN